MGLFSRKQRVQLEAFCREFYDRHILNAMIGGVDAAHVYYQTIYDSVVKVDGGLAAAGIELFSSEMTLVRFEVFGLAWIHRLGEKHAAAQSAFTKRYLEAQDRTDIWDDLEPYNQAIARSVTFSQTGLGQTCTLITNQRRLDFFKEGRKQGLEDDAVARAANRICTEQAWEKGRTAILLMCTLCEHLGCEANQPNLPAQERLTWAIVGLYNGAGEALKCVRIVDSLPT